MKEDLSEKEFEMDNAIYDKINVYVRICNQLFLSKSMKDLKEEWYNSNWKSVFKNLSVICGENSRGHVYFRTAGELSNEYKNWFNILVEETRLNVMRGYKDDGSDGGIWVRIDYRGKEMIWDNARFNSDLKVDDYSEYSLESWGRYESE